MDIGTQDVRFHLYKTSSINENTKRHGRKRNNRYVSRTIQTMSKAEVIAQYEKDFRDFLSAVHQIPEARKTDRILEQWGIKQILDHVASWNLETVQAIQKVVSGGIPWFFDHQDEVDIFNGEQIEKRKHTSAQDVLAEINASHRTLLEFLHQFPDSLFHQSFGKIWHQEAVTPALVCSYRHYDVHRQDIVRYLEQQPNTFSA